MDFQSSLKSQKEMLTAIYETTSWRNGKMKIFLQKNNFHSHVFSAIMVLDRQSFDGVENDLKDFLKKAFIFAQEEKEFSPWWPNIDGDGTIRQAFRNILSGKAGEQECFTLIMSIVMDALETIKNYKNLQEVKKFSFR